MVEDGQKREIEQLQERVENLRCAIGALIMVVIILSGYIISQTVQSIYSFLTNGLILFMLLSIFIICAICYVKD
jgi:hypothetical protein